MSPSIVAGSIGVAALAAAAAAAAPAPASQRYPTMAFTYTDKTQDWSSAVDAAGLEGVYVYAGDVEFYCVGAPTATAGGGASDPSTPCVFGSTAFVYYTEAAQKAAATFKKAGKKVYLNFDGRITPRDKSFVPDFSLLSPQVVEAFAAQVANHVCGDDNVDGMGWDVEPFDNNQIPFFASLDAKITACNKTWGVFAFGESFSDDMWNTGLGKSGFLLDSAYDLECGPSDLPPRGCTPCQCTPPKAYHTVLLNHLTRVTALAKQYQKPYSLMVSGSGTTQLYETLTTSTCTGADGGPAYSKTCPYTMAQWMTEALDVFDTLQVREDPLFQGIGIYGWTTTNGAGFSPTTPTGGAIDVLTKAGYIPYAAARRSNTTKPIEHHQ